MLGFFSFGFGFELPAGRKTVQESSQQAAFSENKWKIYVSNSDNSNQRDSVSSKNHKLGLKFFVRTWLYVQLHEIRNYNTDSILSIDCVIPKGIQENPLSMH